MKSNEIIAGIFTIAITAPWEMVLWKLATGIPVYFAARILYKLFGKKLEKAAAKILNRTVGGELPDGDPDE